MSEFSELLESVDTSSLYLKTDSTTPVDGQLRFVLNPTGRLYKDYMQLKKYMYYNDKELGFLYEKSKMYDPFDYFENSDVIIGVMNDVVVGGARIMYKNGGEDIVLPTETEAGSYPELFPDLEAKEKNYCEIIRLVVHPHYRKGNFIKLFFFRMYGRCIELDMDYIFITSSRRRSRFHKKALQSIDCSIDLRRDVVLEMKMYNYVPYFVLVGDIVHQPHYENVKGLLETNRKFFYTDYSENEN